MKNIFTKKKLAAAIVTTTAVVTAGVAQATDYSAEIGAAATDSQSNVALVVGGVIAIAVIGFGVNTVVNWFKKP